MSSLALVYDKHQIPVGTIEIPDVLLDIANIYTQHYANSSVIVKGNINITAINTALKAANSSESLILCMATGYFVCNYDETLDGAFEIMNKLSPKMNLSQRHAASSFMYSVKQFKQYKTIVVNDVRKCTDAEVGFGYLTGAKFFERLVLGAAYGWT